MENRSRCFRSSNHECFLSLERQSRPAAFACRNRTRAGLRLRSSALRGAADVDDESLVHRLANTSELLAETDHLTEALENALLFLSGCAATRPAFNNFKGEEPEKRHAREFQIEPQIFCDLLDGTHAVEL